MINFTTLFNINYFSRGVALYESLEKNCIDFHLYIFAFDDKCYKELIKLNLSKATIISLNEFENERLLAVKPTRSTGEYCWTCTSSTIKYCIETFKLSECTYLDADLYFFSNPLPLIEEMGDKSVLITEHRYTKKYDQTKHSGKYCVQFMTFKNTKEGMLVLNWWVDACIDWCFAKPEDGKFGDQKYLDDWETRFNGVHNLKHLGGGIAPWNIQQYNTIYKHNSLYCIEKTSQIEFPVIFFHFHNLKFLKNDKLDLGEYQYSKEAIELLYKPYVRTLLKISNNYQGLNINGINFTKKTWKDLIFLLFRIIKGNYKLYTHNFFNK